MSVSWPQGIMLGLMAMAVCRGLLKHGESDGRVNAFYSIIAVGLEVGILWWGGFWK